MADHLRKQIRLAAVAALTGLPTTGPRVYPSRIYMLEGAGVDLPALIVYTKDENAASLGGTRPQTLERHLELVVEGYAAADAALDDTLDAMALEVEEAIAANASMGGAAADCTITRTEVEFEPNAATPHGLIRFTFDAWFLARTDQPDTPG